MSGQILVIGASGLVGTKLISYLNSKSINCTGTTYSKEISNLEKLDIRNTSDVNKLIKEINPSKIFICSALTDVDKCEKDPNLSYDINTIGVKRIVDSANLLKNKPTIIYYSSEYVFSHSKRSASLITDMPYPSNVYGTHKLLAEHYIMSQVNSWSIIRTCNVFGSVSDSKNFALSVLNNYRDNKEIIIRSGQIDTPTYSDHLALFSANMAPLNQISHFVSVDKYMSRFDFAELLINKVGKELYGKKPYKIKNAELGGAPRPNYGLQTSCKLFNSGTNFSVALKGFTEQLRKSL